MRTVRLGRQFDAVFVHDAVCYMTTESDLRQAIDTAFAHCKPGGVALFCPDYTRENFEAGAEHGGEDDGTRGMRWLSWQWQRDPHDTTYFVDYAYLLRENDGSVHVEHDRHLEGCLPARHVATIVPGGRIRRTRSCRSNTQISNREARSVCVPEAGSPVAGIR